jgi:hypothetical protein
MSSNTIVWSPGAGRFDYYRMGGWWIPGLGGVSRMKLTIAVAVMAMVLISAKPPAAVLKGTVRDCNGQAEVRVPDVKVAAFNSARSLPLVQLMQSMDNEVLVVSDTAAMRRFRERQSELNELLTRSTALVRTRSDATGEFTLRVPSVDVFIVAYRDLDDAPNYYAYRTISGRARASFYIDMSRGACTYG